MWTARAWYTTVHPVTTLFPEHSCMDEHSIKPSFDSQATWVIGVLGSFFDRLFMGVCTNSHWQAFGQLVQEFNVCFVDACLLWVSQWKPKYRQLWLDAHWWIFLVYSDKNGPYAVIGFSFHNGLIQMFPNLKEMALTRIHPLLLLSQWCQRTTFNYPSLILGV